MARITVEDCLQQENNRFALIRLAAERTKQLLKGVKPLVSEKIDNKTVVTALREIAEGKVRFVTEEDRRIMKEKARQQEAEHSQNEAAEEEPEAASES